MTRPIAATIDASALRRNLQVVRAHAPRARVMAVIKANAYGHGLLRVAEALREADGFGVVDIAAGCALRGMGHAHPVVLLEGFFEARELEEIAVCRLTPVVHQSEQVEMLEQRHERKPTEVFLKINTGMNRLGFHVREVPRAIERLTAAGVRKITLMTHFARADEEDGVAEQLDRFEAVAAAYAFPRSLANSAGILRHPATHADWVRPGIMLYGASPCADIDAATFGLSPAMTLSSEITSVRDIEPGEAVGYGGTFVAPRRMRIGVVAGGYADGYPRHAPTGTPVLVEGVRCGTVGRVSMDMLCVDLTDVPNARIGSRVTLWGRGLSVDEVAAAAGTIGYELLCALAPRVQVVDG